MKQWVAWKGWLFFHQCSWVCLRLCRIWLWFRRRRLRESCVRWVLLPLLRWRFRWTFGSQIQSRWCVLFLFKQCRFRFIQWFHRSPCWLILNQFWLILKFRCFLWWRCPMIRWWLLSQQFIVWSWPRFRRRWLGQFCSFRQRGLSFHLSEQRFLLKLQQCCQRVL
jgi:hypothetical protein